MKDKVKYGEWMAKWASTVSGMTDEWEDDNESLFYIEQGIMSDEDMVDRWKR